MNIEKRTEGNDLYVKVIGELNTITAPKLEESLQEDLEKAETLTMDLAELTYISSAGLRAIIATLQIMQKKGGMKVCSVREEVMAVFELTGFSDILNIEN